MLKGKNCQLRILIWQIYPLGMKGESGNSLKKENYENLLLADFSKTGQREERPVHPLPLLRLGVISKI